MGWLEAMAVSQNVSLLEYARVVQAMAPADERFLERLFTGRKFSFDAGTLPNRFPHPR